MKRCILVRCFLLSAVMMPVLLVRGNDASRLVMGPNTPGVNWDDKFREVYREIEPLQDVYDLHRKYDFRRQRCTSMEVAEAVETVLDFDESNSLWKEWWRGTRRDSLVRHHLLSPNAYWEKWLHPLDNHKQIWLQIAPERYKDEGERVMFKLKIGF
jgi:hypothetical protein